MVKVSLLGCVVALLFLGCATSNHGTFVVSTYIDPREMTGREPVGKVVGESRQTWFLYVFPMGESPSTNGAVLDAISKIEGTRFLVDLSIDDKTYWKIGYSEQVVRVEATAYK